jgi:hypothetical protein
MLARVLGNVYVSLGCRFVPGGSRVFDVLELSARTTGLGPDFDPVTRTIREATGVAARVRMAGSSSRTMARRFRVGAAGALALAMVLAR